MDWPKALYGAFGAPYPRLSLMVLIVIGGCFFGVVWWLIGREYRKDHPIPKKDSHLVVESSSAGSTPPPSQTVSVINISPEFRHVEDRLAGEDHKVIFYVYHTLRITLSQSGDWSKRLSVELSDADVFDLKQLVPARLRILRSGSSEIVVDVFRMNDASLTQKEGFAQLIREGFIDFVRDTPPGIYSGEEIGAFHLDKPPTLTISVLLDGAKLASEKFRVGWGTGRIDFSKIS